MHLPVVIRVCRLCPAGPCSLRTQCVSKNSLDEVLGALLVLLLLWALPLTLGPSWVFS